MLTTLVLILALVLVARTPNPRTRTSSSAATRAERSRYSTVWGAFLLFALLVTVSSDLQWLLLSIDAIGVEVFSACCALFLRSSVAVILALVPVPCLRIIYRLGPLPNFWPSRELMRSMPAMAAYAVGYPALWVICIVVAVSDAVLHWSVLNS